jgi:hydroxymethylpyrimidine pyrophosphatase-like HAD family hydrolase
MHKDIALLLADVDGTLVTSEKVLTERAQKAVRALREKGIRFAITSGRPPKGMAMLIEPLAIDTPIAGFNGGAFVNPDAVTGGGAIRGKADRAARTRLLALCRQRLAAARPEGAACRARGLDG